MNKTTSAIIIAIVALGLVGGIVYFNSNMDSDSMDMSQSETRTSDDSSQDAMAPSTEVQTGEVAVDIKDFDFQTPELKVKVGTTVTWTNQDDAGHDVNPDVESADFEGSGKLLQQGESYSYTFEAPGTFSYNCTPHPYMKASVEVVE